MTDTSATPSSKLSMASTIVASKTAISTDLDGEVVVLDINNGIYYGLDAVGARIWSLIQQPITLSEVRDVILREYDVLQDVCEQDLQALLRVLSKRGLVNVTE